MGATQVIGRACWINRPRDPPNSRRPNASWSPFDSTLLEAADELHADWCISDAIWAALAAVYDTQQLIELPMLVGQYHMVAMTLNSLGVQLDRGLSGFPTRDHESPTLLKGINKPEVRA